MNKLYVLLFSILLFACSSENKKEINTIFKPNNIKCSTLYQVYHLPSGIQVLLFRHDRGWRVVKTDVHSIEECPVFTDSLLLDNNMVLDTGATFVTDVNDKFIQFKKKYNCK